MKTIKSAIARSPSISCQYFLATAQTKAYENPHRAALHRYSRGAEVAFISIANALVQLGNRVTVIRSGAECTGAAYEFIHASSVDRKQFPYFSFVRNECAYEELTSISDLPRHDIPDSFDATVTRRYHFTDNAKQ